MLRHMTATLCVGLALARGQTFVVDINNGPGTHFIEIQTAVTTVPSGSTLLVRPGNYQPVVIDGKGVVILCEASVTSGALASSANFLTIRNTLPQHNVAVRGLQSGGDLVLSIANCLGPVTFDGTGGLFSASWPYGPSPIQVSNSNQVAIRNLQAHGDPSCTVVSSTVVFENCSLQGRGAFFFNKASGGNGGPGLSVTNGHVQAVRTTITGGNGAIGIAPYFVVRPGSEAVHMTLASLRAMGSSSHPITGGTNPTTGQLPALLGQGVARVDPLIPLTATPMGPGITLTRPTMPSLVSDTALPGGVLQVERAGAVGVLCAVTISLRSSPLLVPGFDPIWIDPQNFVVETMAVTTSAPLLVQKPVPNQPSLRGFQFVWQAADLTAAGVVEVGNPTPSFVR